MAEVTLFIRDTAGDFRQSFGPGEDEVGSANEDVDNIGTFSSLRVAVLLQQRSLGTPTGNIYLRVNANNFDETVLLTAFSSVQYFNPQWFEVSLTNGPFVLELNNKIAFHVYVVGADRSGDWQVQDFHGSNSVLVKSYGTELSAPEKPVNPIPTNANTGIVLLPTLSWEAG